MTAYLTFGELLLRLRAPGRERLFQSPTLEATFGGGEANVAVSLANFGLDAEFVSALPDTAVGQAGIDSLRRFGVDTRHVLRRGERVGQYFLETGAMQRSGTVIYDRAYSAISECGPGDFDWPTIFQSASWLHITGITPALSQSCADLTLEAVRAAKAAGLTVSCDLNYRSKLWRYGKRADEIMPEIVRHVDVGIAGREDCQTCLGIGTNLPNPPGPPDMAIFEALTAQMLDTYPDMHSLAVTLRTAKSADTHDWQACLRTRSGDWLQSRQYRLTDIVDRVGGGDSFAGGLVAGLALHDDTQSALEFATAASALKHSIPGDYNRVSRSEVEALAGGEGSGRVER